eukprot:gb/GECH01007126.1/.p1 GENE.gb/GECH01007126.1/~~gb/GECH01007126.1/.p1  ORF type:complete len:201 (+),score=37.98 gb/GECH01007126.1/:1-603(+)
MKSNYSHDNFHSATNYDNSINSDPVSFASSPEDTLWDADVSSAMSPASDSNLLNNHHNSNLDNSTPNNNTPNRTSNNQNYNNEGTNTATTTTPTSEGSLHTPMASEYKIDEHVHPEKIDIVDVPLSAKIDDLEPILHRFISGGYLSWRDYNRADRTKTARVHFDTPDAAEHALEIGVATIPLSTIGQTTLTIQPVYGMLS